MNQYGKLMQMKRRNEDENTQHLPAAKSKCRFPPCRPSHFQGSFPYFRQPKEVGSFSQDASRVFKHDRTQLKYYCAPNNSENVQFNLREGYTQFIKRDENVKEYLNDLLRWIKLNPQQFSVPSRPCDESACGPTQGKCLYTDFICWRGLLTRVLCSPYETRDGWIIAATCHKGTIYMCEYDTPEKIQQRDMTNNRQQEMGYWGYKFEQYVTSDEPGGQPRTESPVNNNAAFVSVVRTRLNKHSLVFGGEVDCCESDTHPTVYLEMKTSREVETPRQLDNLKKFKMIKWWAQSFLVGIQKIVVGFRDDYGIVQRVHTYLTKDLPHQCKDLRQPWEASVCFNFLDQFLQLVKDTVTLDDPRSVCVFTYRPGEDVRWRHQPADDKTFCFLPAWYHSDGVDDPHDGQADFK